VRQPGHGVALILISAPLPPKPPRLLAGSSPPGSSLLYPPNSLLLLPSVSTAEEFGREKGELRAAVQESRLKRVVK